MKELFRRLFKSKQWWDLQADEDPEPRRVTRQSASPLNQVLRRPAHGQQAEHEARVDRALGNADLEVAEEAFNPYNTGAFDRASSWDKISRQKKS